MSKDLIWPFEPLFTVTDQLLRGFKRRLELVGEITETSISDLQREIAAFANKRTGKFNTEYPIVLWVTSERGGDLSVALAFIGWVYACRVPLVVVGYGEVSSAAAMLLLGSRYRYMLQDSLLYMHRGCPGVKTGMTIEEVELAVKLFHQFERTAKKYYRQAGAPMDLLNKIIRKSVTLSATEALEMKLIDGVLTLTGMIAKEDDGTKRRRRPAKASLELVRARR